MTAYLSNPVVKIATVDLTGWATAASVNVIREGLEDTTFGMNSRSNTGGLYANEASVTLFMDYSSNATYATLAPLVGTKVTLVVSPTDAAISATNPGFTLTDAYLGDLPVLSTTLGELQVLELSFTFGTYTEVTS